MKEINMYVRGIEKNVDYEPYRIGAWGVMLEYKNNYRRLRGIEKESPKSVRMIIVGILKGIRVLKEPCLINVYTHTLYFKRDKLARKNDDYSFRAIGTHQDLLEILDKELKRNNHVLSTIISGKYQNELTKYINGILK